MEVKIINDEKDKLTLELNNTTIAEILRVYLNKDDSIVLAAWKQDHGDKNAVLEIQTKGKAAKKVLNDALVQLEKDIDSYSDEFKKAFK